jgi:peroxiredoxin
MMSNTIPPIGWKARDFRLQGIDGKAYSLAEVRGPKGTLVAPLAASATWAST